MVDSVENNILPFARSYMVVPGKLYAGYDIASLNKEKSLLKLSRLSAVGINHIIDLTEPGECTTSGDLRVDYSSYIDEYNLNSSFQLSYERHPIEDMNAPSSIEVMKNILDSIDFQLSKGNNVYYHCHGGLGRTSQVSCCYMLRHKMATHDNVFDMINHLRRTEGASHRVAPQRECQFEFIRSWEYGS